MYQKYNYGGKRLYFYCPTNENNEIGVFKTTYLIPILRCCEGEKTFKLGMLFFNF